MNITWYIDRGKHCQSHEGVIAFKVHFCHKVAKGAKCSFPRKFLAFKAAVASYVCPISWRTLFQKGAEADQTNAVL